MGKRTLSMLIAALMLMSLVPMGAVTASAASSSSLNGNGTASDPYRIYSTEDLVEFRDEIHNAVIDASSCAKLCRDITFNSGKTFTEEGTEEDVTYWDEPICSDPLNPFTGTFDGSGYTISGLYYYENGAEATGLFGYTSGAEIKNLTIKNSYIRGNKIAGAFVGSADGITLINCHNVNTYVLSADTAGGLVGYATNINLSRCSNSGVVNTSTYYDIVAGGLVAEIGESTKKIIVENCINSAKLSSGGGLIGNVDSDLSINNSVSVGNIVNKSTAGVNINHSYYTEQYPVNYDSQCTPIIENCLRVTSEQLKSGEVTYKLQQYAEEGVWGQTIGTDDYPVLNGLKVYYGKFDCTQPTVDVYSNRNYLDHLADYDTLKCTKCGKTLGTADAPLPITTAEELDKFAVYVNGGKYTLCAVLHNDIKTYGNNRTQIAASTVQDPSKAYKGTFDGNGFTITIRSDSYFSEKPGGLFHLLGDGAVIKNLNIYAEYIEKTAASYGGGGVGILADEIPRDCTAAVTNCTVSGTVTAQKITEDSLEMCDSVGGFIGYCNGSVSFSNCSSSATVTSDYVEVGGFIGYSKERTYFTDCSSSATVTSQNGFVGGFVGFGKSNFERCSNLGNVSITIETSSEDYSQLNIGGFVGYCEGETTTKDCYNKGNISVSNINDTSYDCVGGFVGYGALTLDNCYNYGDISGAGKNQSKFGAATGDGALTFNGDFYYKNQQYRVNYEYKTIRVNGRTATTYDSAHITTTDQFNSGEIAYLLNGSTSTPAEGETLVWGQELGKDDTPVLGGKTVYYGTNCSGVTLYSNDPIQSEHNYNALNGKCSNCGALQDEMSGLYAHNATLGGNIGFNFFMEIADTYRNESTRMNFSVTKHNAETGEDEIVYTKSVPFSADKSVTDGSKTYYKFTCNLAAKEMTCIVKAQLVNGDKIGTEFSYSVLDYAYTILNGEGYDTKTKELVISMLNYGANSQKYFNFNTEYVANEDLHGDLTKLPDTQADELAVYEYNYTKNKDYTGGTKYYGSSLVLNSNTDIKHYLKLDASTNIDSISITDGSNSYLPSKSGDYYYVRVADIPAHKLGTSVTLTVKENDVEVGTISYSPLSYAYSVLSAYTADDGAHDNVRNLVKSLYQYYKTAAAYANSQSAA
ncbi:MAG: hypothetical protein ACI4RP_09500 [Acutalibacteraceae bacterium]